MKKEYPRIIGLCGRQFCGKSMLGRHLVEECGYTRVYVAHALKQLCSEILKLSIEEMDKLKKEKKSFVLTDDDLRYISEKINIPYENVVEEFAVIGNTLTSIRHAYQFIGTELIRKYNPDWHMNKMFESMNPDSKYVIDDVRFPNESSAVRERGGLLVFIVRPQLTGISHHRSEESLHWNEFENLIINNGTEEDAVKQLKSIIEDGVNPCADEAIKAYKKEHISLNNNKKITVIKEDCPACLSITDRSTGWVTGEYNGMEHPLTIEDCKSMIQ